MCLNINWESLYTFTVQVYGSGVSLDNTEDNSITFVLEL